ncbi:hypothetical protein ACQP25_44845 (plasmid) [Microtetraspora malaysiensis]|uniref:hypothetical protein n=1 Tax=Microtetraspora malaysiensis TaxID=161358 RepID=UPI003D918409
MRSPEHDMFLDLERHGWTTKDMAADLGVHIRTVNSWRDEVGPPLPELTAPKRLHHNIVRDLTTSSYRGQLAERLVQVAVHLASMVREEDPEQVRLFLRGLEQVERDMLPIVLAAMVPVDQTPDALLSWVTWDERGRPLKPERVPKAKAKGKASKPARGGASRKKRKTTRKPVQAAA